MTYLFLVLYLIEIFIIVSFEKKIWGTFLTPTIFLVVPFTFVSLTAVFVPSVFGFFPIYWKIIYIYCIGTFTFWLPSILIYKLFNNVEKYKFKLSKINDKIENFKFIKQLTLILLIISYYYFIKYGIKYGIGTDDFIIHYNLGISAHVNLCLRFLIILFIFNVRSKDYVLWIYIVLILFTGLVTASKGWVFIPLLSGLIMRILYKKLRFKINVFRIIYIFLFVFIIFFISYYFTVGRYYDIFLYIKFLLKHILFYLISGIVSFSENIKNLNLYALDESYIFTPIVNVYNFIFNHEIKSTVSNIYTVVNVDGRISNVNTLFGTIYIYSGYFYGFLSILFFSLLYYFMLFFVILKHNIILLSVYVLLLTFLLFSWFDLYFANLGFYEIPFWGICFYVISKFRISKT